MSVLVTDEDFTHTPVPRKTVEERREISRVIEGRFAGRSSETIQMSRLCRRCWRLEKDGNSIYCPACNQVIAELHEKTKNANRSDSEFIVFLKLLAICAGIFMLFFGLLYLYEYFKS